MLWPHTKTPVICNKQLQTKRPITISTLITFYILYLLGIICYDLILPPSFKIKYKNQLQSSDLTIVFIPDSMRYFKKNLSQNKVFFMLSLGNSHRLWVVRLSVINSYKALWYCLWMSALTGFCRKASFGVLSCLGKNLSLSHFAIVVNQIRVYNIVLGKIA